MMIGLFALSMSAQEYGHHGSANNGNKIVGSWKMNDEQEEWTLVFNRDNSGYMERTHVWLGTENENFSYRYDERNNELTVAHDGPHTSINTIKIEWFGDNRFYFVDENSGDKAGPFVRQ